MAQRRASPTSALTTSTERIVHTIVDRYGEKRLQTYASIQRALEEACAMEPEEGWHSPRVRSLFYETLGDYVLSAGHLPVSFDDFTGAVVRARAVKTPSLHRESA